MIGRESPYKDTKWPTEFSWEVSPHPENADYSPHWLPFPCIKGASMKEVNCTVEGLLCLGSSHCLSPSFTNKLSFTFTSTLARVWILPSAKPRIHSGSGNTCTSAAPSSTAKGGVIHAFVQATKPPSDRGWQGRTSTKTSQMDLKNKRMLKYIHCESCFQEVPYLYVNFLFF